MESNYFLHGFLFGKGEISYEEFVEADPMQVVWGHFSLENPETAQYLKEKSGIDPIVVDAMISDETRPRYMQVNDHGALLILRAINQNVGSEFEDMVSVRIYVDAKRIITVTRKSLVSASEIFSLLKNGNGPKTTSEMICQLLKGILSHVEPVIAGIDETTEAWEEEFPKGEGDNLFSMLSDAKKQMLILRRHIAPERDVLVQLIHAKLPFFTKTDLRLLGEAHERIKLYVEDLDVIKDRLSTITDELRGRMASHTNRAMYMFSLVAVIFLPLTFLTGLFGINVGGIPGSESSTAFAIFSGIMMAIAFGLVWFFRKIKWF